MNPIRFHKILPDLIIKAIIKIIPKKKEWAKFRTGNSGNTFPGNINGVNHKNQHQE